MKHSIIPTILVLVLSLIFVACGGSEGSGEPGSIYGVVTDKATGEQITNAGVELGSFKTVTGSDGQFEFNDISAGEYTLSVTKSGYAETSSSVTVKSGERVRKDIQLEKAQGALRIVDDSGKDLPELNFGAEIADVSRQFNIFNDGTDKLEWEISFSAKWIESVSKESGELKAGSTQGIIVNIDRNLLESGENKTTIHVTSNDGNKQLPVMATNDTVLPTLNTLEATEVRTTSALLNAEILTKGAPSYSKRGFVYALTSMPTLEDTLSDLTAAVTEENKYSATVTGLEMGETYYVRGYAINEAGVAYSTNEVKVVPEKVLATVTTEKVSNIDLDSGSATFNGTIVDEGDPAYTERGFVYGFTHNPSIDDPKIEVMGSGKGKFSAKISEIEINKVYYIRAYAINERGVAYGDEVTFNPEEYLPYVSVPGTNIVAAKEDAGQAPWDSAVTICQSSTLAGFTDWRLPTKSELITIYNYKDLIGNFTDYLYWSSTTEEGGYGKTAYNVDFSDGSVSCYNGYNVNLFLSCYVRCVRNAN